MTGSLKSLRRATVLSLVLTTVAVSTAMAQTPASASADDPPRLGSFMSLAATSLTFHDAGATRDAMRPAVLTPQPLKGPSHALRNGALWGLAAGAGFGLVGLVVTGCVDCPGFAYIVFPAFYAGLGAAAGVGIGAIVRAAHHDDHVVSNGHRTTTTVSLAPILSPKRKGMALSMTWR